MSSTVLLGANTRGVGGHVYLDWLLLVMIKKLVAFHFVRRLRE